MFDWTDTEEEEKKEGEVEVLKKGSDDEALVNLIAKLREKKQAEEKIVTKRVKAIAKKANLHIGSVNLGLEHL